MDVNSSAINLFNITISGEEKIRSEARKHILWIVGIGINKYYLPMILPIGFVSNILSFLVMIQSQNRPNSCCNYMAVLSFTDWCMICVGIHYWVVTCGYFRGIYIYECKLISWTFNLFPQAGIALIMLMTLDRFICIRFPFHAKSLCTPKRARISSGVVIVISTVYTSPYFQTGGLVNNDNNTCAAILEQTSFTTAYTWLNMFLVSILPFCCLLTLNISIIHGIHKRRKYLQKTHKSSVKSNKDNQLSVMLLLVSFTYLALTLPLYARYILAMVEDNTEDVYSYALFIFIYHLSNKLYFTNSAINFFLYCISGAKFRGDLVKLFRKEKLEQQISISRISLSFRENSQNVAGQETGY